MHFYYTKKDDPTKYIKYKNIYFRQNITQGMLGGVQNKCKFFCVLFEWPLTFVRILNVQSNSVITNFTGPSVPVRYIRDIVTTMKVSVTSAL